MKERIKWLDTAKFFAIFFVYLSHFGDRAGVLYPWDSITCIPFFFFLSGCTEVYNKRGFFANLWHRFITIIVPYFFFGFVIILYDVYPHFSFNEFWPHMRLLFLGDIRNSLPIGGGLWFLTCLFSMEIIFSLIRKLKNNFLILCAAGLLYLFAEFGMGYRPIDSPRLFWNIDSACYYMIFFVFGFLYFQYEQLPTSIMKRILNTIAVILSATYIAYFISGPDPLVVIYRMNRLFQEFEKIAPQLATIILLIALSKFLQDFELLRKVGGDSLYLCGNEAIGKDMLIEFCTLFFSASFNIYTIIPVQLFLFTLFCLFVIDYTLVRISKPLITKVQNYVQAKCQVLFKANM